MIAGEIAHTFFEKRYIRKDGTLMNAEVATGIYARGPADPYYALLLAEDWPAIATQLAAEPLRNYTPRVYASTVPMLITNCWDDAKHTLVSTVDALANPLEEVVGPAWQLWPLILVGIGLAIFPMTGDMG